MAEVSSFTLHNAQGSCGCFFATLLLLLQVVAIVKCCSSFISVAVVALLLFYFVAVIVIVFGLSVPVAVKLQLLLNKCHITCA